MDEKEIKQIDQELEENSQKVDKELDELEKAANEEKGKGLMQG